MTDSSTRTEPVRVRLSSPSQVVAAVPHLLGFRPGNSLVAVSLRGRGGRVGLCVRADLPPPADVAETAEHIASCLARDGAREALLVVYPPTEGALGQHSERADVPLACASALEPLHIVVRDALRVVGNRWWSYLCRQESCCPPDGTPLRDEDEATMAAAAAFTGSAVLPDRESVVRALDPPTGDEADRMRSVIARVQASRRSAGDEFGPRTLGRFAVGALFMDDPKAKLPDEQVAELAIGVRQELVRDELLLWASERRGERVQRLLADLVRRVPVPDDVGLAVVLAAVAYQLGNGLLARTALERALATDPDCRLAQLLSSALDAGIPPPAVAMALQRRHADN